MKTKIIIIISGLLIFLNAYAIQSETTPSGERIYEQACRTCHAPKLAKALQAPAAFDVKAWKMRLQNANEEAKKNPEKYKNKWDYLVHQVRIGKGLMHHGGLCKEAGLPAADCTDSAYIAAIKYMSEAQPEKLDMLKTKQSN